MRYSSPPISAFPFDPVRMICEQPDDPITITELMRLSSRQLRERAYGKRPPLGRPKPNAPYSETGRLGPDDLKRWRKEEPPIEIIE
jgi:hypothetical protein